MPLDMNRFKRISPKNLVFSGVVLIVVIAILLYYFLNHAAAKTAVRGRGALEQVVVQTVQSLSPDNAPLSLSGKVTSEDEATVLSQISGEIVNVDKQLGDKVSAGDTIATFENSSQQAAELQAEGSYNVAVEALAKASGSISSDVSDQAALTTRSSLVTALENAYAALDDAVHTKADMLFTNPRSVNPTLLPVFAAAGNDLVQTLQHERASLEDPLNNDRNLALATSEDDLTVNITQMTADAETIETFLNNLVDAVNDIEVQDQAANYSILPAVTITSYQTTIASARTEVDAAIASLNASESTYDVTSQNGQVEEAQGAFDAAKSAFDKTIVTSPISGTIIALPVTTGDYVQSGSEIAEVSNPSSLKIVTNITAEDAQSISLGNAVTIDGNIAGTVTSIAPAIDPQTGAIEVDIGLPDNQSGLVDQDSVNVDIDRNASSQTVVSSSSQAIVPIVALKITPTGPVVFTVEQGNKQGSKQGSQSAATSTPQTGMLVSHPVSVGSILGSNIVVISGLTPDMKIVTDARGLTSGEAVSVKNP